MKFPAPLSYFLKQEFACYNAIYRFRRGACAEKCHKEPNYAHTTNRSASFFPHELCNVKISILSIKRWPSSRSHFVANLLSCFASLVTLDLFMYVRKFYAFLCHFLAGVRHQSRGPLDKSQRQKQPSENFLCCWQTTRELRIDCQRPQASKFSFIFKPEANNLTHYQVQLTIVCN